MHLLLKKLPWFKIAIASIFLLSLGLRFWGLERFNTLVFDEVYYAKYAVNYLNGIELFDAHPPLGKYIISLGIWLSKFFPIASQATNDLTGPVLSPISYRWMNALVGSCIPIIVAGIAYQLSARRRYAILAGLFCAVDGFFLVESRYALINIYLVFFGLLGQWLFLLSLTKNYKTKAFLSISSGICFGAAISVKWNGLGFLLGVYLIYFTAILTQFLQSINLLEIQFSLNPSNLLSKISRINFLSVILNFAFIPALVYWLAWIPHLQINTTETFFSVHQQILSYHHTGVGSGVEVHPYCSRWYTWPLMLRSVSYFYERSTVDDVNSVLPSLPANLSEGIYDVHLLGNPILWWLSSGAIVILILRLMTDILPKIFIQKYPVTLSSSFWTIVYLLINYAANFLPWMLVRRCTFLYLYMSAFIFSVLAFAWLVDRWFDRPGGKIFASSVISIVICSFIFWLPIYLGLPLSAEQFQLRMLLQSWI